MLLYFEDLPHYLSAGTLHGGEITVYGSDLSFDLVMIMLISN
jgi:hypothetical protein